MDVILGHENLDFDSVASMVAAKHLHPDAEMFLQPTAEGPVREFLNLYQDHYSFKTIDQFDATEVETLIIVDTNRRERIGPYAEALDHAERVVLYDHHPPDSGDLDPDETYYDSVGALITYMVELLTEKNCEINPSDATLFLLGLHQETGSLQFGSATARDYSAGRIALENGANLDVVQNFANKPLSNDQLDLFNDLLESSRNFSVNDVPITLATARRDEYQPEVAMLAHKLQDTENANFLCLIVRMGDRVQVVFRNRYDHLDVSRIAEQFGGGGHARAASATLSGVTVEECEQALMQVFNQRIKPKLIARDIMSTPVHSIRPDLPVEEAHEIMLRLDHQGLPITDEENELIGIITRTDVEKAIKHDLTHAPVKGFMSPEVVTVGPETSLERLQTILSNEKIGRLPVIEADRLIGIVTRTDIIRTLHQNQRRRTDLLKESPPYATPEDPENVRDVISDVLPDKWSRRLRNWGDLAESLGDTLYLVGGCVRDILLCEPTKDFDFILEEDAIRFGQELVEREGGEISTHAAFRTAVVTLPDGDRVDLATARSEYYSHPAALPEIEVEQVSLVQDLRRRDFTINAMAIQLTPDEFGDLIDVYGGREDLEEGWIRVLYAMSFVDDPTRIFRAIRFAERFDFEIEEKTLFHLKKAVGNNPVESVSGDRLRQEFNLIFREGNCWEILERLFDLGVLEYIQENLRPKERMPEWFRAAQSGLEDYSIKASQMVYYCILCEPLSLEAADEFADRLNFRRPHSEILRENARFREIRTDLEDAEEASEIYGILTEFEHDEVLVARKLMESETVADRIDQYLNDFVEVTPLVTGDDLKDWGVEPGPRMGGILDELFYYQLDHNVDTKDELRRYFKNNREDLLERREGSSA